MAEELFVKRAGSGPTVVLLHGLFGAGNNLGALARGLQEEYDVCSVDLPNHGRSAWLANPDIAAMADALRHWMDGEGVASVHLVGHSLGGKVAMQLALREPHRVRSLVVADIAPVAYLARHDAVFAALQAVARAGCSSRAQAGTLLASYLKEDAVIQFLLSSLQRDESTVLRWRFDLEGIQRAYPALLAAPQPGLSYAGQTLFIKGELSDYTQEQHWPAIQTCFPLAVVRVMPGCGHWLHVEKPQLFNGIVARFLALVG